MTYASEIHLNITMLLCWDISSTIFCKELAQLPPSTGVLQHQQFQLPGCPKPHLHVAHGFHLDVACWQCQQNVTPKDHPDVLDLDHPSCYRQPQLPVPWILQVGIPSYIGWHDHLQMLNPNKPTEFFGWHGHLLLKGRVGKTLLMGLCQVQCR